MPAEKKYFRYRNKHVIFSIRKEKKMGVPIKDIQRNNKEIIRIEVSEFKGMELINIRIWYQAIDGSTGDMVYKPTQKGVTLNISEFAELKDGIDRLEQFIKDREGGVQPEQPGETRLPDDEEEDDQDKDESDTDEPAG